MWRDPSRGNQVQVRYVMSDSWGEPIQINRRPDSKMSFSKYEKEQLAESMGILTVAFTLALSNGLSPVMKNPEILINTLPLAFGAVMTGFLLHELAHKWMAQQYGCWASYRGNINGLYFALLMSCAGFLLAAPGAVMVSVRITDRQNGIIAAVGPISNIIIALVALYRPGPMSNIPIYNQCKHGEKKPDYLHPKLRKILEPTYGVIIYQEQVMQIAQKLSGFTAGEADILRRAMGKKKRKELEKQEEKFIKGAINNGIKKDIASFIS